ncbi:hypothetical protein ACFLSE_03340 [Bacteroidota bacterium]
MKKSFLTLLLLVVFTITLYSQVYENPIASKQSHPELEITRIKVADNETVVSLKVTNKLSQGGWFCADKNIYLKSTKGTEIFELTKSENIPTCPNKFEFAYTGQTLEFMLYFPPIPTNIQFIDLIESCSNACFSFYGIILDNEHNNKIRAFEKGFDLYRNGDLEKSIPFFEKVLSGEITIDSHIYGLSYYYLIITYKKLENKVEQEKWYNLLIESDLDDKQTFIKELSKEINIE